MNYFQLQYMKLIRLSLVAETTLKIKVQIKKILNKQGSSLWEKIISAWLSLLIFSTVWSLSNFAHRQYGAAPQSHFYS